jgi:hypothetical protein
MDLFNNLNLGCRRTPCLAILLVLAVVAEKVAGTSTSQQCVRYEPLTCLFGDVDIRKGHCHPAKCDFDIRSEMGCVFPESGEFTYSDPEVDGNGNAVCSDPFMTTKRRGPEPCGGESKRCCRADHKGDFVDVGPGTRGKYTKYEYRPTDSDCQYQEITRGQILHYLHSRGSTLAVMGDSMMRQFFLRLVMMIRGQTRLIDYHQHSHAQYAVCREADAFRVSTSTANETSVLPNNAHLLGRIPSFFRGKDGPGTLITQTSMTKCSRAPVEFHYLHVPRFVNQIESIPKYLKTLPLGSKPVLLLSVGYWQNGDEVPEEYLEVLKNNAHKVRKVFLVSVPTVRVVNEEARASYKVRNAFIKDWVAAQGEPFAFLDYDTMSLAEHPPPGGSSNNWHYMCSVAWRIHCVYCDLVRLDHQNGVNEFGEPLPQFPVGNVERVLATEDGSCSDEMNRNLWQSVFNTLITPASK